MSTPTDINVERICQLAHFRLEPEERERFQKELGPILAYVNKLSELDLDGIDPTPYGHPVAATLRPDVVEPSLTREQAMDLAADADRDHGEFRQPKIVE